MANLNDTITDGTVKFKVVKPATTSDISDHNNTTAAHSNGISGNAATATKLKTARTINIQDSSATNTGTGASFDGSGNATIKLPATIKANITGNASGSSGSCTGNAATATKLATARTINIQDSSATNTGTGASFDGSGNATIKLPATIKASITGNCSGSSGSCTGNAATATKATGDKNGKDIAATYLPLAGGTLTGALKITNSSSQQFRIAKENYGAIFHNDGSSFYILATNSGEATDGGYNSFRPLKIDFSTGKCDISGNAATASKATYDENGVRISTSYAPQAQIDYLANVATNSVSAAVSAKNDAVTAKNQTQNIADGLVSIRDTAVDTSLAISGQAADSKTVGDKFAVIGATQIDNDEYLCVWVDSENRILFGVKKDGSFTWKKSSNEELPVFIQNSEFVQLLRDKIGNIVEGIATTGDKQFFSPVHFFGGIKWQQKDIFSFFQTRTKTKGKRYAIMGDSISVYRNGGEQYGESYYYPSGDVVLSNDMWWKKVEKANGLTFLATAARSGSTVCGNSSASDSNAGCSNRRIALLGVNGKSPDIILVLIGVNDYGTGKVLGNFNESSDLPSEGNIEDFSSAYALMLYKMKVAYPKARIFCGSIVSCVPNAVDSRVYPYKNSAGLTIPQYNNVIKTICNIMNATFVDIWDCGINDKNIANYTVDGHLHPNAGGMSLIAEKFNRAIQSM